MEEELWTKEEMQKQIIPRTLGGAGGRRLQQSERYALVHSVPYLDACDDMVVHRFQAGENKEARTQILSEGRRRSLGQKVPIDRVSTRQ